MRIAHGWLTVSGLLLVAGSLPAQTSLRPAIQSLAVAAPGNYPPLHFLNTETRGEKKSVWIALGYSLLMPGLGNLYADDFKTGRYYLAADVALWATYGGFQAYGSWLKQDAQTFASQRAGANFDRKGDQFAVDLGNFANTNDYNDAKLRNRQFNLLYDANSDFSWQWYSDDDRLHYKDLRIRGDAVIRSSQFVLGALVLNRIIAGISAARAVAAYNRTVQTTGAWRLRADVKGGMLAAQNIELTLTRDF